MTKGRRSRRRETFTLLLLAILLLVSVTFALDFTAALAIATGSILGAAFLPLLPNSINSRALIPLAWLVLIFLIFSFFILRSSPFPFDRFITDFIPTSAPKTLPIAEYSVKVEPVTGSLDEFKIEEAFRVNDYSNTNSGILAISAIPPGDYTMPERFVRSTRKGALLQEISFQPLRVDANDWARVEIAHTNGNSRTYAGELCGFVCPRTSIILANLPEGSFYAARDAVQLTSLPYVDSETIEWTIRDLTNGISFTFLPPRMRHFGVVLRPFVSSTEFTEWMYAAVGFLFTFLAGLFTKTLFPEVVKGRLGSRRKGVDKRLNITRYTASGVQELVDEQDDVRQLETWLGQEKSRSKPRKSVVRAIEMRIADLRQK